MVAVSSEWKEGVIEWRGDIYDYSIARLSEPISVLDASIELEGDCIKESLNKYFKLIREERYSELRQFWDRRDGHYKFTTGKFKKIYKGYFEEKKDWYITHVVKYKGFYIPMGRFVKIDDSSEGVEVYMFRETPEGCKRVGLAEDFDKVNGIDFVYALFSYGIEIMNRLENEPWDEVTINCPDDAGESSIRDYMLDEAMFVEVNEELCPIVAVKDSRNVIIKLPSGELKTTNYDKIHRKKVNITQLPEKRITVCGGKVISRGNTTVDLGTWSTGFYGQRNIEFEFELLSNELIRDVYVVFQYYTKSGGYKTREYISFASIGDLVPGKLNRKEISFKGVNFRGGVIYDYYFFSNGNPIMKFYMEDVVLDESSNSLRIPWNARMEWYLDRGEENNVTCAPKPIERQLNQFDVNAVKDSGMEKCMLTVLVKKDGTVEFVNSDGLFTTSELADLKEDIKNWRILPPLADGIPFETEVGIPLAF